MTMIDNVDGGDGRVAYTYFVSFHHSGGFGRMCILGDHAVQSWQDVLELEKAVLSSVPGLTEFSLLWFQLIHIGGDFDTDPNEPEPDPGSASASGLTIIGGGR